VLLSYVFSVVVPSWDPPRLISSLFLLGSFVIVIQFRFVLSQAFKSWVFVIRSFLISYVGSHSELRAARPCLTGLVT